MSGWNRQTFVWTALLAAMALGLTSCGGNDGGGTTPPADHTAPLVISVRPHSGDTGVELGAPIVVAFSEAMDPTTAAAGVTVTPATGVTLTWTSPDTLTIGHAAWAQGAQISVQLGVALKDVAGNPLPAAISGHFWAWSALPRFLSSTPDSGAANVPINSSVVVVFSQQMDITSLGTATSVLPIAPRGPWEQIDWNSYRLQFSGDLAAGTEYTLTIGTGAVSSNGGTPQALAAPAVIRFTTGVTGDTTPPHIVSLTPSRNATGVSASTAAAVITFSEPVEPQIEPTRVGAQAFLWVNGEPQWSAGNTVLTLYFRAPLPAGVRLFAVFGAGSYRDLVGNVNTIADSLAFTVAGSADYVPLTSGSWSEFAVRYESSGSKRSAGIDTLWYRDQNIQGDGTFDRVRARDPLFTDIDDLQHFQLSASALKIRGFYNRDSASDIWITPPADYLRLPLQARVWSGTGTMTDGSLTYDVTVTGPEALPLALPGQGMPFVLERCWRSVLTHTMTSGGATVSAGTDTIWWAPALGIVRQYSSSTDANGGTPRTSWSRSWLIAHQPFGD